MLLLPVMEDVLLETGREGSENHDLEGILLYILVRNEFQAGTGGCCSFECCRACQSPTLRGVLIGAGPLSSRNRPFSRTTHTQSCSTHISTHPLLWQNEQVYDEKCRYGEREGPIFKRFPGPGPRERRPPESPLFPWEIPGYGLLYGQGRFTSARSRQPPRANEKARRDLHNFFGLRLFYFSC